MAYFQAIKKCQCFNAQNKHLATSDRDTVKTQSWDMRHDETWKLETEPRRDMKNNVSRQSGDKIRVWRLRHCFESAVKKNFEHRSAMLRQSCQQEYSSSFLTHNGYGGMFFWCNPVLVSALAVKLWLWRYRSVAVMTVQTLWPSRQRTVYVNGAEIR